MNPVAIDPDARDEIDNALAVSRNAARLRTALAAALARIQANPQIGVAISGTQGRQYAFVRPRLPYSIVYVEETNRIRVVAFPHHKRRPGYWRNRLPKP